jgi:hypothetical protein
MSRKAGILAAVNVAVLAINLDVKIVDVALPSIATELDADTRGLQWVVDGYNLTFAALVLAAPTSPFRINDPNFAPVPPDRAGPTGHRLTFEPTAQRLKRDPGRDCVMM